MVRAKRQINPKVSQAEGFVAAALQTRQGPGYNRSMTALDGVTLALADEAATQDLGRRLAAAARPGDVYALEGPLGSGKSTLARAFIRALSGPHEDVPSPTFTLVQGYDCDVGTIWHYDLYRLARAEDALELGIEEAFAEGVCLIEWPERLGPWLPAGRLTVLVEPGPTPTTRQARLLPGDPSWRQRLSEMFK
jgi:tRNA threonylcarbamoyladenosine biosynthesis protein TsaE